MSETDKSTEASFLSRWSRRKIDSTGAESVATPAEPLPDQLPKSSTGEVAGEKMPETPPPEPTLPGAAPVKQALPSIDSLTHEADFSPFMAKDVAPGLRNQAMKKLFTDPHYQFEQMDKLDIYLDDYSQPDPIPLEMLRQMNMAKRLFLFDDEEKGASDVSPQPDAPAARLTSETPPAPDAINTGNAADATDAALTGIANEPADKEEKAAAEIDPRSKNHP